MMAAAAHGTPETEWIIATVQREVIHGTTAPSGPAKTVNFSSIRGITPLPSLPIYGFVVTV